MNSMNEKTPFYKKRAFQVGALLVATGVVLAVVAVAIIIIINTAGKWDCDNAEGKCVRTKDGAFGSKSECEKSNKCSKKGANFDCVSGTCQSTNDAGALFETLQECEKSQKCSDVSEWKWYFKGIGATESTDPATVDQGLVHPNADGFDTVVRDGKCMILPKYQVKDVESGPYNSKRDCEIAAVRKQYFGPYGYGGKCIASDTLETGALTNDPKTNSISNHTTCNGDLATYHKCLPEGGCKELSSIITPGGYTSCPCSTATCTATTLKWSAATTPIRGSEYCIEDANGSYATKNDCLVDHCPVSHSICYDPTSKRLVCAEGKNQCCLNIYSPEEKDYVFKTNDDCYTCSASTGKPQPNCANVDNGRCTSEPCEVTHGNAECLTNGAGNKVCVPK